MKALLPLLVLFCGLPMAATAQAPVSYDDVGVIINVNDTNSVAIGEYFASERGVPARNIIRIDAPAQETITGGQFDTVRAEIESYLVSTGLVDSLNYLVTTKGVPLRVNYGGTLIKPDMRNASFDAEIMLILGDNASHIGRNTLIIPPNSVRAHQYFMKDEPFKRAGVIPGTSPPRTYDMFLTTRLTGLTREDAIRLIDRSGPFTFVDKDSALFVFDRDPRPIQLVPYDSNLAVAGAMLGSLGWNVLLNEDSVFVTGQRNVIGYASWGSNDHYDHHYTTKARPGNHWVPGSLAETYVSTSARNFTPGQTGGQSRIADLIEEGCTGASGYVFEPYSIALTWVNMLFDRYLRGYNLAESYYMSNPTISWMAVVVGDPKTSIITEIPPLPDPRIVAPATACIGASLVLQAEDAAQGWERWFLGDSLTVINAGGPYDDTHPLWAGDGSTLSTIPAQAGDVTYTFMNENFIGRSFTEATVTVLPELEVALTLSADTVYLDENYEVQFIATAAGAISWEWTFGDGTTSTDQSPTHSYTRVGTYPVSVRVSDGTCETTVRDTVYVRDARPRVTTDTHLLAFGDVRVFSQTNRSVQIRNNLSLAADLQSVAIEGPDAALFTLAPISLPLTIDGGGNVNLTVTYAPQDTGTHIATMQIHVSSQSAAIPVQLHGHGIPTSTGIADAPPAATVPALGENYPNPFASRTAVPFTLPARAHVRLSVYDALGRRVAVIADDVMDAGPHTVLWDAGDAITGSVLCVLEADGTRVTRRMTIVR